MSDTPNPDPTPAAPVPPAPTPTPTPAPAGPPAALTVIQGGKTEREIALEREIEEHKTARTKAERDAAYALDEARKLKEIQTQRPAPTPKAKKGGFRTLLHEEED